LKLQAAFILLKTRFFEVEQDLEPSQHGIADGAAISQIDQRGPLPSDQFKLQRNELFRIPCLWVIRLGFAR
jgi:hypothetical protein